ncbi:MAG: peptide MFS transporter [Chitinophagaceae bacterium]|nr:peptide MFS transporter [Oligoflexus sp.]
MNPIVASDTIPPEEVHAEKRQPPALYLLFFVEMWERMSYYGMRALLVLYMTAATTAGGFGWSKSDALSLYGWYTGLVYLTPLLGGFVADRYLGLRKSVTLGASIMMIGHIAMAVPGISAFYLGLGCLILGNGFFKPSMGQLVGGLFEDGDKRRDGAYTIFYVGVNTGAFLAPFVSGTLGEKLGFHWGFGAAAVGMFIGQILFLTVGPRLLGNIGIKPAALIQKEKSEKTGVRESLSKIEKDRLFVIVALMIFVVVFWTAFEQAGGLMTLYTDAKVNRNVLGFVIPTTWFQAANPIFIMTLGPLFAWFWTRLALRGKDPSAPTKFGWALLLMGLGFTFMVFAARESSVAGQASIVWILLSYLFQTMGELCMSPVGLSMVNKLTPSRFGTLMMGIWYLSFAVANKMSGVVGSFAEKLGEVQLFGAIAAVAGICGLVLLLFVAKPLQKKMHGIH